MTDSAYEKVMEETLGPVFDYIDALSICTSSLLKHGKVSETDLRSKLPEDVVAFAIDYVKDRIEKAKSTGGTKIDHIYEKFGDSEIGDAGRLRDIAWPFYLTERYLETNQLDLPDTATRTIKVTEYEQSFLNSIDNYITNVLEHQISDDIEGVLKQVSKETFVEAVFYAWENDDVYDKGFNEWFSDALEHIQNDADHEIEEDNILDEPPPSPDM